LNTTPAAVQRVRTNRRYNVAMETSSTDDYGTRERRAYRSGWLAGIGAEPETTPTRANAALNLRWLQGFDEGVQLRRTWTSRKSMRAKAILD